MGMWTHVTEGIPFGHYRLGRMLGGGGMGRVYEAFDTRSDRIVALKVLPPHAADDPEFRERFRRESRAAASLNDPHVIPIHQYGEIDGHLYLDMRLVQGDGVDTVLARRGPMAPALAVSVVGQVASALAAAHAQGLIHRDVKPSNMLLCADDFVYLIDFGIARGSTEKGLTTTGAAIGTFAYMSPERLAGVADIRSDVYALACVLHECLTGTLPFPGTSLEQQIAAHLTSPPPRPSIARPEVPATFDEVIARGMSKNPATRYQTAAELAFAARKALAGADAAATRATITTPAAPQSRRLSIPHPEPQNTLAQAISSSPSNDEPTRAIAGARGYANRGSRGKAVLIVFVVAVMAGLGSWYATRPEHETSPAGPPPAVPTFAVGKYPESVLFDSATHTAYVGSEVTKEVRVVDTVARTLASTLDFKSSGVSAMALDPDAHTLYIAGLGSVSVIDTTSRSVTASIQVENNAAPGLALDRDNHILYASYGLRVAVIDTVARTVTSDIYTGNYSGQLALDSNAQALYAINGSNDSVSVIDTVTRKVAATIKVGKRPDRLAIDPATHTAYVTNLDDGSVSIIDTLARAVITTIPFGRYEVGTNGIALDPATHIVYLACNDGKVRLIDGQSHAVMSTVQVGDGPTDIAVDPATHIAYVINNRGGSLSVIER